MFLMAITYYAAAEVTRRRAFEKFRPPSNGAQSGIGLPHSPESFRGCRDGLRATPSARSWSAAALCRFHCVRPPSAILFVAFTPLYGVGNFLRLVARWIIEF